MMIFASLLFSSFCDIEHASLLEIASKIEQQYVIEQSAKTIAQNIRSDLKQIPLAEECQAKEKFAELTYQYLREVSGDGHFYFEVNTNEKDADWIESWEQAGRDIAYGVERVEILDGNIGLIKISSFYGLELAFKRFDAAFQLVRDTKALILDLRQNGGGSSETAWPLQWTFIDKDSELPMRLESRQNRYAPLEKPPVLWTHYGTEKPLVILVDKRSFSAPEAVAYSLQAMGRATIIGQQTGGGAHMLGDGVSIQETYTLYIPEIRPIVSDTDSNWEKTGVIPDILASEEFALETAIKHISELIDDE